MSSPYSSASMIEESSVDPTRSQKTTVMWRSSLLNSIPMDSSRMVDESSPIDGPTAGRAEAGVLGEFLGAAGAVPDQRHRPRPEAGTGTCPDRPRQRSMEAWTKWGRGRTPSPSSSPATPSTPSRTASMSLPGQRGEDAAGGALSALAGPHREVGVHGDLPGQPDLGRGHPVALVRRSQPVVPEMGGLLTPDRVGPRCWPARVHPGLELCSEMAVAVVGHVLVHGTA